MHVNLARTELLTIVAVHLQWDALVAVFFKR